MKGFRKVLTEPFGNLPLTFPEPFGNLALTFRQPFGNLPITFREPFVNLSGTFPIPYINYPERSGKGSYKGRARIGVVYQTPNSPFLARISRFRLTR